MTVDCAREGCERTFDTERGMKIHRTQYHEQGKSDDELLEDLNRIADEMGHTPTKDEFRQQDGCYTPPVYQERFGSWNGALREAGLEVNLDHDRRIELECDFCGDGFDRVPFRLSQKNPDRVFCSNECRVSHLSKLPPEENPGWVDGRTLDDDYKYRHSRRFRENRKVVLERDNYRCQSCGISNDKHREKMNQGLHVHHIRPVNKFDDYNKAHDVENMIALCATCHRKWEGIQLKPEITHPNS